MPREATTELEKQIEAAFAYRGNVTLTLKDGARLEGYLFNRELSPHPTSNEAPFAELFLLNGEQRKVPLGKLQSVELTGQDHAEAQ